MKNKTNIIKYLIISFGWTWGLWITGLCVALIYNKTLATDMTVFDLLTLTDGGEHNLIAQLLFALAVFGPFIGYLVMKVYRPFFGKPSKLMIGLTIGVPLVSLLPALLLSLISSNLNSDLNTSNLWWIIITYFIANLITSGTEEFGWRGYLYPSFKNFEKDFWKISLKGGIIWAVWHLPLMIIMYWSLGFVLISVVAGFIASIIAMNYITNVIYEKSNSILLTVCLHALNNTATFVLVLLFPETPFTIIIPLMAWGIVAILEKKIVKHIDVQAKEITVTN